MMLISQGFVLTDQLPTLQYRRSTLMHLDWNHIQLLSPSLQLFLLFSLPMWTLFLLFAISIFKELKWRSIEPKEPTHLCQFNASGDSRRYFHLSFLPENPSKLFNYISSLNLSHVILVGEYRMRGFQAVTSGIMQIEPARR